MSLNETELAQVRDVIVGAIETLVLPRFDVLEEDIHVLKEDVRILKEDVRVLKEDVRILKGEMREMKDYLGRLDGRVMALEADIKELYEMATEDRKHTSSRKSFEKLPFEQKVLQVYEDFQLLAKQAGITLPQ